MRNTDASEIPFLPSLPPETQLIELHRPFSKIRLRFGLCLFHGNLLVQELLDKHLYVIDLESFGLDERDALMLGLVVVHHRVPAISRPMTIWLGTEKRVRQVLADVAFELLSSACLRCAVGERT